MKNGTGGMYVGIYVYDQAEVLDFSASLRQVADAPKPLRRRNVAGSALTETKEA
jgi:hypothetical protein